jgi:hypothetical protein
VAELEMQLTMAGFSGLMFRQTLFPGPFNVHTVENGYGKGSFVVVRARKAEKGTENYG